MKSHRKNQRNDKLVPEEVFFGGAFLCLFLVLIFVLLMFLFPPAGAN